jgi:hypothetical protein
MSKTILGETVELHPIGFSFAALVTVTNSSTPPIAAQKFAAVKVE